MREYMGHAKLGRVPDRFFFMTAADDRCTVYMKVDIGTSCTILIFRKRVSQLNILEYQGPRKKTECCKIYARAASEDSYMCSVLSMFR